MPWPLSPSGFQRLWRCGSCGWRVEKLEGRRAGKPLLQRVFISLTRLVPKAVTCQALARGNSRCSDCPGSGKGRSKLSLWFPVPVPNIPLKLLFRWDLFAVENFTGSDSGGNRSSVEFPVSFSLSLAFPTTRPRVKKAEERGGKRACERKGLFLPDLSQISQKKHFPLEISRG